MISLRLLDRWLISLKRTLESKHMSLPQTDYFDANLPGASQTVRIASLYDAKVFVCRWVIRERACVKGASSRHGKGQEFYNDGERDPAIDTGARLTRIVGHDQSVVIFQQAQG